MKTSNNYWRKRAIQMEDDTSKLAASRIKRMNKLYERSYNKIIKAFNMLYTDIEKGEVISRADLYRYANYLSILKAIDDECKVLGQAQLEMIRDTLNDVFEMTIGFTCESLEIAPILLKSQSKAIVDTLWSGEHFSTRVWNNTNALATKIKGLIEDEMVLGKMPDAIKKDIMQEFGVSYRAADKLQRTEAAYVHNKACIESYKTAGIQKVRYLAEVDACDVCKPCNKQKYNIGEEPVIPQHPFCRCCYIPIVK